MAIFNVENFGAIATPVHFEDLNEYTAIDDRNPHLRVACTDGLPFRPSGESQKIIFTMKTNIKSIWPMILLALFAAVFILPIPASAQNIIVDSTPNFIAAPTLSPATQNFILGLLTTLAAKYPFVATLIGILGTMRLWAKPAFSFIHSIVDLTPTMADDGWWSKAYSFFTTNPVGKFLAYLLDWLGSIKLTPPAKPATAPTD